MTRAMTSATLAEAKAILLGIASQTPQRIVRERLWKMAEEIDVLQKIWREWETRRERKKNEV